MTHTSLRSPEPPPAAGLVPDRVPLSYQQEFLQAVDHGDGMGPFGPKYTIVGGWRLTGALDPAALHRALGDVVARHEALRTRLVPAGDEPHQEVRATAPVPELELRDLGRLDQEARGRRAEELVNDVEADTFGLDQMPLLRAVLGRFDDQDAVLVLAAHHTAVDGWSIHVVVRDLAEYYAARIERRAVALPPPRQYREYVAWQRAATSTPAFAAAREYWRETLRGAQMVTIPTDQPRGHGEPFATGWHRFLLDDHVGPELVALAARRRGSPFMVALAAYLVYLRQVTGQADLVVPTFTPGRNPAWVQDSVGSFYHLVPLRVDIAGCASFADVIGATRAACLAAYRHEIPFLHVVEEAPELMEPAMEPDAALCVFQVTQSPHMARDGRAGGLCYTAIRRRALSAPRGSQLPDGVLLGLELDGSGLIGSAGYTDNIFTEETIATMAGGFSRVLAEQLLAGGH